MSLRPDSFEMYAIHRPSGENIGLVSLNRVLRKAWGLPGFHPAESSPSRGRIIVSLALPRTVSKYARYFPLGCHEAGYCGFALSVRRTASPVPSARWRNRLNTPPLRCE